MYYRQRIFQIQKEIPYNIKLTKYQGVEMMFNTGLVLGWDKNGEIGEFDIGVLHLFL